MAKSMSVEKIDKKLSQLGARKQDITARDGRADRRARNHALIVLGSLLEKACGGDWREVDWDGLASCLQECSEFISGRSTGEKLSTREASARLREWENRGREAKAAKKQIG